MIESRHFHRAAVDFPAAVSSSCGEPIAKGRALDLSEGGTLLSLDRSFPDGTPVTVALEVSPNAPDLSAAGVVARTESGAERVGAVMRVAVEWVGLTEENACRIQDIVAAIEPIGWGDDNERLPRAIAERFIPIIRRVAKSVARVLPPHVSTDDLVGAAFVAFVEFYGKQRSLPADAFERAARARIRGAMLDELRGSDPLTRRMRRKEQLVASARRSVEARLCRPATREEVAAHACIDEATYDRIVCASRASRTSNLRDICDGDLVATTEPTPEDAVAATQSIEALRVALTVLPPRHRKVLELYYGQELTLRAIGNSLGVSEARICQLLREAVSRLRENYGASEEPVPPSQRRSIRRRTPRVEESGKWRSDAPIGFDAR